MIANSQESGREAARRQSPQFRRFRLPRSVPVSTDDFTLQAHAYKDIMRTRILSIVRIVPAFLIAPIPGVIAMTILAFKANAEMASDSRAPLMPFIALAVIWIVQALIGVPIVMAMRRSSWIGIWSFAFGGAVMMIVAGSTFWIPLVIVEVDLARQIHRFAFGMAAIVLLNVGRFALCGAFTGVFFYWLTRGRHNTGDDLKALRQRFE